MTIPSFNTTLSTVSFYILLAIADRPLHAYGIRDQVAHDSDGQLIIATGTLYPALKRLAAEGLIEQILAVDARPGIKHRYRITTFGQRQLAHEARRHGRLATHARYKLGEKLF